VPDEPDDILDVLESFGSAHDRPRSDDDLSGVPQGMLDMGEPQSSEAKNRYRRAVKERPTVEGTAPTRRRRIAKVSGDVALRAVQGRAVVAVFQHSGRLAVQKVVAELGWQPGTLDVVVLGVGFCAVAPGRGEGVATADLDDRSRLLLPTGARRLLGHRPGGQVLAAASVTAGLLVLLDLATLLSAVEERIDSTPGAPELRLVGTKEELDG
jgi:hypothetical protein